MTGADMWIIYFVGVVINSFLIGLFNYDASCDPSGLWLTSVLWPLAAVLAIICGILHAPLWLGDKVRRFFQ